MLLCDTESNINIANANEARFVTEAFMLRKELNGPSLKETIVHHLTGRE